MAEPPNRSLLIIGLDIPQMAIHHCERKNDYKSYDSEVITVRIPTYVQVASMLQVLGTPWHDWQFKNRVIGYLEPILCMVSTPAPSEFHSARACGINLTAILILSSCFHSISACVFCVWVKVKGFCCEHHSAQSHRNSMWCWSHHIFSLTFEPKGRWSKFVLKTHLKHLNLKLH